MNKDCTCYTCSGYCHRDCIARPRRRREVIAGGRSAGGKQGMASRQISRENGAITVLSCTRVQRRFQSVRLRSRLLSRVAAGPISNVLCLPRLTHKDNRETTIYTQTHVLRTRLITSGMLISALLISQFYHVIHY